MGNRICRRNKFGNNNLLCNFDFHIEYFEQSMDATVFYEASPSSPTQLVQIPKQAPSFRISGGTSSLLHTLLHKLDEGDVLFNQFVKHIKSNKPIFDDKLLISSTESAPEFPGYMEGAVHSAKIIAEKIRKAQYCI